MQVDLFAFELFRIGCVIFASVDATTYFQPVLHREKSETCISSRAVLTDIDFIVVSFPKLPPTSVCKYNQRVLLKPATHI